jgi:predicted outer membrane repeat protein
MNSGNSNIQIKNSLFANNRAFSGGAIFIDHDNKCITISGCNITGNVAEQTGGGIYLSENNDQFAMLDSKAQEAAVILETEHPYIVPDTYQGATTQDSTIIYETTVTVPEATGFIVNFDGLTTFQSGLVLTIVDNINSRDVFKTFLSDKLPGVSLPSLHIVYTNSFTLTFRVSGNKVPILSGLYGIKLYVYPNIPQEVTVPNIIANNYADRAGGMMIYYANQFSVILNAIVTGNVAESVGGGIVFQNGNIGGVIQQVIFRNNTAGTEGGGLVLQSGQFGMNLINCTFDSNVAGMHGGAFYLSASNGLGVLLTGNPITLFNIAFIGNVALTGNGGAIYGSEDNVILLAAITATTNQAVSGSGGAFYFGQTSFIEIFGNSSFQSNSALGQGGAIFSFQSNVMVFFYDITFVNNFAGDGGGAIALFNHSIMSIVNGTMLFQENKARTSGGAILIAFSPLWQYGDIATWLIFAGNEAPRGSAAFLYRIVSQIRSASFSNHIIQTSFVDNVASVGGTVFWVFDEVMNSEPDISDPSNYWHNNVA